MAANKVTLNGETLIDLTQDTANESDVAVGKTFHKSNGAIRIGTNSSVGGAPSQPSPLPIEVSTETKMNELLETAPIGAVYKYVGETTATYVNGGLYLVEVGE
jgi:hypothetical protein